MFIYKAQVKKRQKYLNSTTVLSRKLLLCLSDYRRGLQQKSSLKYYINF